MIVSACRAKRCHHLEAFSVSERSGARTATVTAAVMEQLTTEVCFKARRHGGNDEMNSQFTGVIILLLL